MNTKRDYTIILDLSRAGYRGSIKHNRSILFYSSDKESRNIYLNIKGTDLDELNINLLIATNNGLKVAELEGKRHESSVVEYNIANDLEVGIYKAQFLVKELGKVLASDPFKFEVKKNLF